MASLLRPRVPTQTSASIPTYYYIAGRSICLVVGLSCIAGFIFDTLILGLPVDPFNLTWRIGFLQQAGDRSIIFLFGSALVIYSQIGNRRISRPLSLICLGTGVALMLSCIVVIRDSLVLQDVTVSRISNQAEQLQLRIEESQESPGDLPEGISLDQLEQAAQQVTSEADRLKQTSRMGITKSGLSSMSNLIIVGLGLVGLGRVGLVTGRRIARGG